MVNVTLVRPAMSLAEVKPVVALKPALVVSNTIVGLGVAAVVGRGIGPVGGGAPFAVACAAGPGVDRRCESRFKLLEDPPGRPASLPFGLFPSVFDKRRPNSGEIGHGAPFLGVEGFVQRKYVLRTGRGAAGLHRWQSRQPIAFRDGLDGLDSNSSAVDADASESAFRPFRSESPLPMNGAIDMDAGQKGAVGRNPAPLVCRWDPTISEAVPQFKQLFGASENP